MEAPAEPVEVPGPRHLQLVVLADVADVDARLHLDGVRPVALGEERGAHPRRERREPGVELGRGQPVERPPEGLDVIVGHPGHDAAQRREHARVRGDDHPGHAELLGQAASVERPGPAVGDQREVPEVATALDRDEPDGAPHGGVRHLENPRCRLGKPEAERLGYRLDRRAGAGPVDADRLAEQGVGPEGARHGVRVGDGGGRAPEAVARGPGPGARAFGPDPERRAVGAGERPSAGADRFDADRGQPHGLPAEPALGQVLGPAIGDQADVRGRPAHVEGDGVPETGRPREEPGRRDAAGGAGDGHGERPPARDRRRHHGAARLEKMQRRPDTRAGERGLEVGEIAVRDRHHRRVQRRRRGPLVLAELGVDLVGDGDEGDVPLEGRAEARLVRRMRVGMEETNGHRLHPAVPQRRGQRGQLVIRERHRDPAVGEDSLRHLEPEVAGHERRHPGRDVEPVELLAALPGDLQHVPEAPRRDERGTGVPALDDGVGDDRRPVRDRARVGSQRLEAGEHPASRGVGRRENLARADRPRPGLDGDEIGERPADVDPDADAHGGPGSTSAPTTSGSGRGRRAPPPRTARPSSTCRPGAGR